MWPRDLFDAYKPCKPSETMGRKSQSQSLTGRNKHGVPHFESRCNMLAPHVNPLDSQATIAEPDTNDQITHSQQTEHKHNRF